MGAERIVVVMALVTFSGCGLIDADGSAQPAPPELCEDVAGRTPAFVETYWQEDEWGTTTTFRVYTEEGWLLRRQVDLYSDALLDAETVYLLDERGRTTREETRPGSHGAAVRVTVRDYEEKGVY